VLLLLLRLLLPWLDAQADLRTGRELRHLHATVLQSYGSGVVIVVGAARRAGVERGPCPLGKSLDPRLPDPLDEVLVRYALEPRVLLSGVFHIVTRDVADIHGE
jgi:hypothetical protein